MARNNSEASIAAIPADEIAEVIAANDIAKSGRSATVVDTNTVVEDRTKATVEDAEREYAVEHIELDGGTTLTSYGEEVA